MRRLLICLIVVCVAMITPVSAAVIDFLTDPFAGSPALGTPGRQIVGGEPFISFLTGSDVFALDQGFFGISEIHFANDVIGNLPTTGVNVVVLRTFDNDADPTTPFGAGNAANLIADRITTPGPGVFVYFNSGLNLPRLVYSTDLSDNTADLKILARMTNLTGDSGALANFTASNFASVPEPASLLLMTAAGVLFAGRQVARRRRIRG